MKVILTLLVRDEEDVIRPFLDYHLQRGVDLVVATDNRSQDGTKEILEEYRQRGRLVYRHEPDDDYAQAKWVTRMARLAARDLQADWVIHRDVDEFWWPEFGDLKTALARVPRSVSVLQVPRRNFLPRPLGEAEHFLDRMIYRETYSTNDVGKPLMPKVCHRAHRRIRVARGNHSASVRLRRFPAADSEEISIFHFPVRSLEQLEKKIANGGAALERSRLPPEVCRHWRSLYDELRSKGGLREHFKGQIFDQAELAAALARGEVVEDRRLQRFMATMSHGDAAGDA
jgi:hypothetical protein